MKKILTNLKMLCTTETGMIFKKLKTPTKHINTFSISLLTFMTIRFQNRKLKLNSRVIRALGILNADEFNKFLTSIGTFLANKISNASKRFDSYITRINTSTESQPFSINELKDAFFTQNKPKSGP